MSEELSANDAVMREKLLDLALDDVEENRHLLEYDVKPFLRKSNSKPKRYNPNEELIDEDLIRERDEDVWSHRRHKQDSNRLPIPEVVLSGRSRRHFEGMVGKIFAYNLLFEVNDDDLQSLFGAFGPLKRAAINYDRNGRSMGTAFIVFINRIDAQTAFRALDGHSLDSRKLFLRLLDCAGMRGEDRNTMRKNRGDERPINDETVLQDNERLTVDDLDMDLETYVHRRKRAKTWNYY